MTMIHIIMDAEGNIWAVTTDYEKGWNKLVELERTFEKKAFKMQTMTDLKDM